MIPQPEVQQVDRDAAAELLGGAAPDGLLDGRQDTLSLVQTLARHRAAAFEAGRAEGVREAAEVAETLRVGGPTLSSWVNVNESPMGATQRHIATAIRALSKEITK